MSCYSLPDTNWWASVIFIIIFSFAFLLKTFCVCEHISLETETRTFSHTPIINIMPNNQTFILHTILSVPIDCKAPKGKLHTIIHNAHTEYKRARERIRGIHTSIRYEWRIVWKAAAYKRLLYIQFGKRPIKTSSLTQLLHEWQRNTHNTHTRLIDRTARISCWVKSQFRMWKKERKSVRANKYVEKRKEKRYTKQIQRNDRVSAITCIRTSFIIRERNTRSLNNTRTQMHWLKNWVMINRVCV